MYNDVIPMNEDGANEDEHTHSWTRPPDREIRFAAAEWGKPEPSGAGRLYRRERSGEAEWELPALFMSWVDIVPAPGGSFGLRIEGDTVILTGVLENIEEDGAGYLRIGRDLIMFECLG